MVGAEARATVDPEEIERFAAMSEEWWKPRGQFAPLHRMNPVRLAWIKEVACRRFGRDVRDTLAFRALRVLDIGCGGGLLSEPLARLGATVTGIDPSETTIGIARHHAERSGVGIDYRATTAEALAAAGERFDVVLAMEVVEHVADVAAFISACGALVAPRGLFVASTINRTPKAHLLAIVAAESVLRWLPRGTHSYDKLVRPEELEAACGAAGLSLFDTTGVVYEPLRDGFRLSDDRDVNYMIAAVR